LNVGVNTKLFIDSTKRNKVGVLKIIFMHAPYVIVLTCNGITLRHVISRFAWGLNYPHYLFKLVFDHLFIYLEI